MYGRRPILPACLGLACGDASTDTSGDTTNDTGDTGGEPEPPVTRGSCSDLVRVRYELVNRAKTSIDGHCCAM